MSTMTETHHSAANDDDPATNYVETYVNYWQESSDEPPPDQLGLSTHALRISRRTEDSPNCRPTRLRIHNMRGHEPGYNLSKQGFQICRLDSSLRVWTDPAALKEVYFEEISALLKRVTGAIHVHSYEHHIRQRSLQDALSVSSDGEVDIAGPVRRVHIDETPRSARREFAHYLPPHASAFNAMLQTRPFGIYNVWKPLRTVRRDPLCVCDVRSLRDHDLRVGAVTVPNMGEIENYAIRPPAEQEAGRHRFHFLKNQTEREALVFRIFDSRFEAGAERQLGVAHTSFVEPGTEAVQEARESVEVRSFCVF